MPTPGWSAARNGLPGDTTAVDKAAQINQLLGTHGVTPIYEGAPILTPSAGTGVDPNFSFAFDYDQPFTLTGTTVGRVVLPITPVGNGADLQVSLYTDSAGNPGTLICTTRIPARWITAFAASAAAVSSDLNYTDESGFPGAGKLQTAAFNSVRTGASTLTPWASPAVGSAGGASDPTIITSGNWLITLGGTLAGTAAAASAFTVGYPGGGDQLGNTVPQPSLPLAVSGAAAATTTDTIVVAGGLPTPTDTAITANVYTASWDSTNGQIGAWAAQTPLPQTLSGASAAASGETVYICGGFNAGGTFLATVYHTTISNGQIGTWLAGPSLPVALFGAAVAAVGDLLVVAGGELAGGAESTATYYAAINSDGSLGAWQTGPPVPIGVFSFNTTAWDGGLILIGGEVTGGAGTPAIQSITIDTTGPAPTWGQQTSPIGELATNSALFSVGPGMWQMFNITGEDYISATVYAIPQLSVPLPATGLTNGSTYHVVLHQQAATHNDYLLTWVEPSALPDGLGESPPGANTWTRFPGFALPISVYNQAAGGQVLHTWEDSGARITTLVYATTPDTRLLGVAEATQFLDGSLDASVSAVDYPGTWPVGVWPPLGVEQL